MAAILKLETFWSGLDGLLFVSILFCVGQCFKTKLKSQLSEHDGTKGYLVSQASRKASKHSDWDKTSLCVSSTCF